MKFEGGDLKILEDIHDFQLCKNECESYTDCFFFTSSHFGCFLKSQDVEIQKRVGFVSGASDDACGEFFYYFCNVMIYDKSHQEFYIN